MTTAQLTNVPIATFAVRCMWFPLGKRPCNHAIRHTNAYSQQVLLDPRFAEHPDSRTGDSGRVGGDIV